MDRRPTEKSQLGLSPEDRDPAMPCTQLCLVKKTRTRACSSYLRVSEIKTRETPYRGQGCEIGSEAVLPFSLVSLSSLNLSERLFKVRNIRRISVALVAILNWLRQKNWWEISGFGKSSGRWECLLLGGASPSHSFLLPADCQHLPTRSLTLHGVLTWPLPWPHQISVLPHQKCLQLCF